MSTLLHDRTSGTVEAAAVAPGTLVSARPVGMYRRADQQPPQKMQGAPAIEEIPGGIRRWRISAPICKAAADADITDYRLYDHRNRA